MHYNFFCLMCREFINTILSGVYAVYIIIILVTTGVIVVDNRGAYA